ncbi:MAG: hypothetical protein LBO67_07235 [Spirochaetaceae bacterium]|jgi:hypothetical protein|nr:hypothetical protein [Spirochaetaceae bacterium]
MPSTSVIVFQGLKETARKAVNVGSGLGVWEYVFYSCDPGTEVLVVMHLANRAGASGKNFLKGSLVVNNTELSSTVKSAMGMYNANICVTFGHRMDDPSNNQMIINVLTPDRVYSTYLFETASFSPWAHTYTFFP